MWARLKRLFRAIFGGIIDSAENPELILQQLIRDIRDHVPEMNNNVAQVMGHEKLLQQQVTQLTARVAELDSKIKTAIRSSRDDIATAYLGELQSTQKNLEITQANYQGAKSASEKARKFRDNYLLKMKQRQDEAMQLIAANKQAAMQERIAETMASFNIGDASSTFDDMREKINQRAATAEAKAELANDTLDNRMLEIEHDANLAAANDALLAYKRQMGLLPAEEAPALGEGAPPVSAHTLEGVDETTARPRARELTM